MSGAAKQPLARRSAPPRSRARGRRQRAGRRCAASIEKPRWGSPPPPFV